MELASIVVSNLGKNLETFRVAVNKARQCENTWHTIAPGASKNKSKSILMSHNNSSLFKDFSREERIHVFFLH